MIISPPMNAPPKVALSVIVPLYNEEENVQDLYSQIVKSCEKMGRPFEVLIVDDGSTDRSFALLKEMQGRDPRLKVIRLRRNFGQTAAMSAGFDHARGEIIITLDADLQNDPADFPGLLEKIDEGYDVVSGWRKKRRDRFLTRKLPSVAANWLISKITGIRLHDNGCTLKAFRSEVVKNIKLYGELHRFIPAIASNMGISIAEVRVNHRPRLRGKSKYNLTRAPKVLLDLMTVKFMLSYSTRPLQVFGILGMVSGLAGFVIGIWLSYQRLILKIGIANRPLLLLAILLMVIGFQFVVLGLLAEIMVRAYHESTGKNIYFVRQVLDAESGDRS